MDRDIWGWRYMAMDGGRVGVDGGIWMDMVGCGGEMWGDVGRYEEQLGGGADLSRHHHRRQNENETRSENSGKLGGAADHGGDDGHAPVVGDEPREADGVLIKYRFKYRSALLHYLVEQSRARGRVRGGP